MPRNCFNCHCPNHLSYNCPKAKKESEYVRPSNFEVQAYFVAPQKELPLKDITLGDKTISNLIDSGSSVSLIREDVSTKIVDQQKLSKKCNILLGIGNSPTLRQDELDAEYGICTFPYHLETLGRSILTCPYQLGRR
ncbi:hypothetical protein NPIL_502311 [Nephila pilipes]|uniref:CCHC-type domain-containing protein n=1 Tax=Nephila pilipes TaxID=299642 RepID=A0A8X6QAG9_NEPPI|nr:hypothetical protein NPIL_502311 [Nephila pilipes]